MDQSLTLMAFFELSLLQQEKQISQCKDHFSKWFKIPTKKIKIRGELMKHTSSASNFIVDKVVALITLLISFYPVAKKFATDGSKIKGSHFSTGSFITYAISNMRDLLNLLLTSTSRTCLMLGKFNIMRGDIVTKGVFDSSINVNPLARTRTKAHTSWHPTSVMFFDYDWTPDLADALKVTSFEELYTLIIKVLPEFKEVEMLFKFSSSSNIYDVALNQFIGNKIGIHVYFMISSVTDETVLMFRELIRSRLWALGLQYYQLGKDNSLTLISLFDESVMLGKEREIIESQAILPPNLAVYTTGNEPRIFNEHGKAFDLKTINLDKEFDYKPVLEAQKQSLQGDKYRKPVNVQATTKNTVNTTLTASTTERLSYLRVKVLKNSRIALREITPYINSEIVQQLLQAIGYQVSNYKFKLRATERTASASIMADSGFVVDFGGSFKGSFINLLMKYHSMDFKTALKYLFICLGAKLKLKESQYNPLPNPKDISKKLFSNIKLDMNIKIPAIESFRILNRTDKTFSKKSYNLAEIATNNLDIFGGYTDSIRDIIDIKVLELLKDYKSLSTFAIDVAQSVTLGYSYDYNSLSIILKDEDSVVTVAIRRNNTPSKQFEGWSKWKTYGSKNYIANSFIPCSNTVYIAFGMMEIVLLELLDVSYIVFQSDFMAQDFEKNAQFMTLRNECTNLDIVLLIDNDESCSSTVPILKRLFRNAHSVRAIDFEVILGETLEKGFDYVDYCNAIVSSKSDVTIADLKL